MAANRSVFLLSLVVLSMAPIAIADILPGDIKVKAKASVAKISVQGSIFCLSGNVSTSIKGATARISCNSTVGFRKLTAFTRVTPVTDIQGFYMITFPASLLPDGGRSLVRCKAFLNSSPLPSCNVKTNINGGILGAPLRLVRRLAPTNLLVSVKPFFFGNTTVHV
ncbi:hypothetical protein Ancab_019593 [Ancistrocladus abbreviatus]